MTIALSPSQVQDLLENMAAEIRDQLGDRKPLLVGIHTGGVWVAKALQEILGADFFDAPLGTLNIAYYRDDFTRIGMHPQVTPSDLPFSVDGRHLLLVDDVLHSGRTTRAALNEIFDYGRPASVCLAVLMERNGRELPIQADIIGESIELPNDQHIKLTNTSGLQLEYRTRGGVNEE
ncbi:bifunctional pyr operon transcriptional regulator/uracil phosphoribosyltransferase PyrR [Methylophaga sp. OBS4]|uniref:bifunctional pyr operon transcriptional regulator/uracil phosphoribosyltransferase PyrR n=1 Tax=Methylophaga sp. OBS4 TaxID=2991935 RepID=UPI00224EC7B6|nr:bifunctional pyr operon transcriptional regulator/uracil phosphoribosyltransferase PyrR [Methylophaga sp. OBS4]MCX4186568.1 bifunctional pyr operon transcriptional regulator/uracil phosphoribosyltransferase PyrR [Methylophaga sp. OBS4]